MFHGGRTLGAIQAVCTAPDLDLDPLDGVEALVSQSLLQRMAGPDDEPRFWMLETLHEYAREKLRERGEEADLRRKHAHYFLDLAEAAG